MLVAIFDLAPLVDTPVRQLSLGERMRCEIAASLLHAPQLLFLDEPTIGLDVSAKATIRLRRCRKGDDPRAAPHGVGSPGRHAAADVARYRRYRAGMRSRDHHP